MSHGQATLPKAAPPSYTITVPPFLYRNWQALVVFILIFVTAVWLSLSSLQSEQNGDSIVPVLVSLQHWTAFYWEQDRFGMLVPLLARPIHNPLHNLIFQSILSIFAAIGSSFLLALYLFDAEPFWLSAAALQNIWLFLLVPSKFQFDWLMVQPYAASLFLAFWSLVLIRRGKFLLPLFLMVLASWVNSGFFILLVPLVVFHHLAIRRWKGLPRALLIIALAAASGLIAMSRAQYRHSTEIALTPPQQWMNSWKQVLHTASILLAPQPKLLLWMVVPAAAGLLTAVFVRSQRRTGLIVVGLVLTSLCFFLAVAPLTWVATNLYLPRYVYPSLLLVSTGLAVLSVAPLQFLQDRVPALPALAAVAMLLCGFISFGEPSLRNVRATIDSKFGGMTNDILATNAEVIAGTYWKVWPAVFHANLVLYERGESRRLYADTFRATPTLRYWINEQSVCVDVPRGDAEAAHYMQGTGRTFHLEGSHGTVEEYCGP